MILKNGLRSKNNFLNKTNNNQIIISRYNIIIITLVLIKELIMKKLSVFFCVGFPDGLLPEEEEYNRDNNRESTR